MSDKDKPKVKDAEKAEDDVTGVQPNPGVGQTIPNDKGKANTNNNPAGQGNEGDEVMPAGRETPG
ncbi:MAG: hypothetical protein LCI00_13730 [Chloroflexi bacterium]|nr:hypothetical protein [Chloroflexota bacterium]MCC6892276.1 hypothetical protein [Anaerolineae bacterium]